MKNTNIKVIFVEKSIANESKIELLKSNGMIVFVSDVDHLEENFKDIKTPLFHQCAIGGKEFLSKAKELGVRCVYADKDLFLSIDEKNFPESGKIKNYEVDENAFIETEIDIEDIGHLESLFALGNGYLGLRGTFDERDESILETPGMYINGIFDSEPITYPYYAKGFAKNDQFTVNLCDWRIIEVYIDGEKACFTG